ncbi:MAG: peptidylprolyl isomerase [Nocardioidaceae bacterium]|nr:peptidylprolyl isomerase [Nocardioidaceae bacterium]
MRTRLLAGVPALLLLATLTACSDDGEDRIKADNEPSAADSSSTDSGSPSPDSPGAAESSDGAESTGGTSCEFVPSGEPARDVEPPQASTNLSGKIPAVITTSIGKLKVTLDADKAPCTVASFESLVEQGYYDDTSCHRQGNDPGFEFLQCGDPTGTGAGGPGYTIPDEIDGSETYPAGTLAMANTGAPNSGGGQFFLVFGDSTFPPAYTVWGKIDPKSLAALKKAASSGNQGAPGQGGQPNTPVTFKSIKVG